MTISKVWKIRRKSDGLFSTGGMNPKWHKNGKAWTNIGHLKNHLNVVREAAGYRVAELFPWQVQRDMPKEELERHITAEAQKVYEGCEIVTYEVTESVIEVKDL